MKEYLGRRKVLKEKINNHLTQLTKVKADYFSKFNQSDFLKLKTVLTDVNNVLTLKLTLKAAKWLGKIFELSSAFIKTNSVIIDQQKPNTAGFDIVIEFPYKIIAEVKCLVPVNDGYEYGAMQWIGIMNDVIKLKKGTKKITNTDSYFKFIFLLNLGAKTDKAIEKLLKDSKATSNDLNRIARHEIKQWLVEYQNESFRKLDIKMVHLVKLK